DNPIGWKGRDVKDTRRKRLSLHTQAANLSQSVFYFTTLRQFVNSKFAPALAVDTVRHVAVLVENKNDLRVHDSPFKFGSRPLKDLVLRLPRKLGEQAISFACDFEHRTSRILVPADELIKVNGLSRCGIRHLRLHHFPQSVFGKTASKRRRIDFALR